MAPSREQKACTLRQTCKSVTYMNIMKSSDTPLHIQAHAHVHVNTVTFTNLFFKCCMRPRHLNRLLTIIASLVHSASHSSMLEPQKTYVHGWALYKHLVAQDKIPAIKSHKTNTNMQPIIGTNIHNRISNITFYLCEVRITERPPLMRSRMRSHKNRRECGSMPVVGSSWNVQPRDTLTVAPLQYSTLKYIVALIN